MSSKITIQKTSVHVFPQFCDLVSEKWIENISYKVLAEVQASKEIDTTSKVDIVIADDLTVRDLNKRYRGLDETTDVLSFSFDHHGEFYGICPPISQSTADNPFVLPPGEITGLGEVIISYPQAVRQAEKLLRTPLHELANLLIHGILHLQGFNHDHPDDDAAMRATETKILNQVIDCE